MNLPPVPLYTADRGWLCPLCNRSWAPAVKGCDPCNKARTTPSVLQPGRGPV